MRRMKRILAFLLVFSLAAGVFGAGPDAAWAKTLKTQKITLYEKQSKTIKTSKKIKSIDEGENVACRVEKTGAKKLKFIAYPEIEYDYLPVVKQTVTVTYTDGSKQKFLVTQKFRYAEKIMKELKGLLKDPDQSIRELAEQYCPEDRAQNGRAYRYELVRKFKHNEGKGVDAVGGGNEYETQSMEEMLAELTPSQKQAAVLQLYFTNHMSYGDVAWAPTPTNGETYKATYEATYKAVYDGKFLGACGDSAEKVAGICDALGFEVRFMTSVTSGAAHSWACIAVTDKDGTKYWEGVDGTSYACNVVWDYKGIVNDTAWDCDPVKRIILDYDPANYCDVVWDDFVYNSYSNQ